MYSVNSDPSLGRVSPFRYLRINACCQLPEAFRRLPRLSSPSTAKASTMCACSLDHITQNLLLDHILFFHESHFTSLLKYTIVLPRFLSSASQFLKNCKTLLHGARRVRTADPLLAKQVLSQLSYGPSQNWWVWIDLNYRPHAYQACALTS
jgi:hypothetical protein